MSDTYENKGMDIEFSTSRWKELFVIGGICGILMTVLTLLAIVIYFIWPYTPGMTSVKDIFVTLQNDKLGGLMSLDFFFLIVNFVTIPFFLALYFAVKKANESYALLGLVFGLICCIFGLINRPIAEMFILSDLYATATTDLARIQYIAAGEALGAIFNGTVWMLYFIMYGIQAVIASVLMLRIREFNKITSYIGIFMVIGVASIIPGFSKSMYGVYLNLITTTIGTIWNVLVALTLFRFARGKANIVTTEYAVH